MANVPTYETLYKLFLGEWQFQKEVSFLSERIEGTTEFKKQSFDTLEVLEKGQGTASLPFHFFQRYEYQFQENRFFIFKGRETSFLHEFLLKEQDSFPIQLRHTHQCSKDFYQVELKVLDHFMFDLSYEVIGPQKHYFMKTMYHKKS